MIIAIPWCTGTIIGLAARAIEKTPIWHSYPSTLTLKEVNSGLVMPYVLQSLLGTGATTGLLVLIFMAITSTISSSLIAVSSIISFDFFRTYINPQASDRRTLQVGHLGVVFHGCFMAGFAIMLQYAGATNNWTTYFRPIVACPGIMPMILALLWSRQTKIAAIVAPVLGLCSGLAVWLALSWHQGHAINITTTQLQLPGLYGAITSFFSPLFYSVVISLAWPGEFDWREFLRIELIEDKTQVTSVQERTETVKGEKSFQRIKEPGVETKTNIEAASTTSASNFDLDNVKHPFSEATIKRTKKWAKFATAYLIVNILATIVLWPMPLYREWIFTRSFFNGWVSVAIMWQWFALLAVVVYPVYDGRHAISRVIRGLIKDSSWIRCK